MDSHVDYVLEELRQAFEKIDHWLHVPFFEFLTQIPEGKENDLYDLADKYEAAAQLYADHVNEVAQHLKDIYGNWQGDGAAMAAASTLQQYLQQVSQTSQAMSNMEGVVRGGALNIESTKWMAILNLVMLLVTLIQVIVTLIFSFGASAAEGAGAIAVCKQALAIAWRELLAKIRELTVKALVKMAIRRGIEFAAFTALSKIAIYGIESAEGHDPTWDWSSFAGEVIDSFTTGFIGGPLTFGLHNPLSEALSMAVGQVVDNEFKNWRSELIDKYGLDWAKNLGLYVRPEDRGSIWDGVGQAALFGGVMGVGGLKEELPKLIGEARAELGLPELGLGKEPGLAPSGLEEPGSLEQPGGLEQPGSLEQGSGLGNGATDPLTEPGTVAGAADARGVSDEASTGTGGQEATGTAASDRPGATEQPGAAAQSRANEQSRPNESTTNEQSRANEQPRANEPAASEQSRGGESATSEQSRGNEPGVREEPRQTEQPAATEGGRAEEQPVRSESGAAGDVRPDAAKGSETVKGDETVKADATVKGDATVKADATAKAGESAKGGESADIKGDRPGTERPGERGSTESGDRSGTGEKTGTGDKAGEGDKAGGGEKSSGDKSAGDRAAEDKTGGEKSSGEKSGGDKAGTGEKQGVGDKHGDAGTRTKPRWYEWRKKFDAKVHEGYEERLAKEFIGRKGLTPLSLHTDMIDRALEHREEELGPLGKELRRFVEQHFSEKGEDGVPRGLDDRAIRAKLIEMSHFPRKMAAEAIAHGIEEDARNALERATSAGEHWVHAAGEDRVSPEQAAYDRGRGLLGEVLDRHFERTDWDPHSPEVVRVVEAWSQRVLGLSRGEFSGRPEALEVRTFIEKHFGRPLDGPGRRFEVVATSDIASGLRSMFGGDQRHVDAGGHGEADVPTDTGPGRPDAGSFEHPGEPEVRPHGDLRLETDRTDLQWSNDGQYVRSAQVERSHYEQAFARFPVENYEGRANSPEARAATHQAALKLVEILHEREVGALHDWFQGTELKDTYLAKAGRTVTAVMLDDGQLHASTSVKEITLNQASRPLRPGEQLPADMPSTKNAADVSTNHPAVQEVLDGFDPAQQSQFRGRCGEPSALSSVARAIEPEFLDRHLRTEGVRSFDELTADQKAAYHRAFAAELEAKLRGGQITSHYATGVDVGREQFPCASDDLLIEHYGLHTDYVDRIVAGSKVDVEHGVISLIPADDPLRPQAEMLASAHPDWLVVAVHGKVGAADVTAMFGDERLTHVEVARLVKSVLADHEGLSGRTKIVLVSCDAGTEHAGLPNAVEVTGTRPPTSFARELAQRLDTDVVAPKNKVWVSNLGRVWVGEVVDGSAIRFESGEGLRGGDWIRSDAHGGTSEASQINDLLGRRTDVPTGTGPEHWERAQGGPFGNLPPVDRFVPEGRSEYEPDVYIGELRNAALRVEPGDFGDGSVVHVEPRGSLLRVETADGRVRYFRPEVAHDLGDVARTEPHRGTAADPHILRVNDRVAHDQLGRAWVHGITEGLQHESAAHRPEVQGVIRRPVSRVASLLGRHEAPEGPREPHGDVATEARLNERRYLLREYWSADSPEARLRVHQDLAALDHELARAGYPVHELEHPPEPAAHGAEQSGGGPGTHERPEAHDGRDHSTHDELWNDPPWERGGRRPSLDELIPSSFEEAAKWEPRIQEAFAREIEGRQFAGMRVRLSLVNEPPLTALRNYVEVRMDVVHPERGMVGSIVRVFHRDETDGSLWVDHHSINLTSADAQGTGFAREWNAHLEDWYRYSGVDHIRVHASWDIGGYAWARDGYDWAPGGEYLADRIMGRLRTEMRAIANDAEGVRRHLAGESTVDIGALRQKYGKESPHELLDEMDRQYREGREILDRAARYSYGGKGYPTPLEVSRAGWTGERGPEASWLGKRVLLGSEWRGVKVISDTGPNFPRSAHFPAELSGDSPIHAWQVPGGEFGGHSTAPTEAHRTELMAASRDALPRVLAEHGGLRLTKVDGDRYTITLPDRGVIQVRVETQWLGVDAAAETHLNHDSGRHVIQLSDQLGLAHVERALAHEIGEIVEDRTRYMLGELGERPDALRPGAFESGTGLSPHDAGRVQELRVLGRQLDDLPPERSRSPDQELEYQRLHREALALVDHLGLRDGDPGAPGRRQLIDARVDDATRARIDRVLHDAGRAEDAMSPEDRAVLEDVRRQAALDQARLDRLHEALAAPDRPVVPGTRHITLDEARRLADQATEARSRHSAETLRDLRQRKAAMGPDEYPKVRLQLGGGASLAGRDPHALLVDARGRWQADNGRVIAQPADQLRNLNRTGLGDPYQFVDGPGQRVPLEAVRYWEDSIAARGPVIDGDATMRVDEHGRLLVDITPQDGSDALTLEVEGRPVITTGFPPEIIPGVDRQLGMRGTFADVSATLNRLRTPEAARAKEAVDALSWYRAGSAKLALKALTDAGVDPGALREGTLRSLRAIERWDDARRLAPGESPRVLFGDEANLAEVNGRPMDPAAAHTWVVAGAGGTGISGVENMLRNTDGLPAGEQPKVVMVGRAPTEGLGDNKQWREVRSRYDPGYDEKNPYASSRDGSDGPLPNPNPEGGARLTMKLDTYVQDFEVPDPGAREYAVVGVDAKGNPVAVKGEGLIASLGGRPGFPPAIAELVDVVMRRDPGAVTGELLFDNGGQYLGYRLTVDGRVFDVTGAASRFLPPRVFEAGIGEGPAHPASELDDAHVWSTPDSRFVTAPNDPRAVLPPESAMRRDAPPESGNFDGGYVATAVQVSHYAAFAAEHPATDPTHAPTDPNAGHPPAGGSGHAHLGGGRLLRPADMVDGDVQSRWAAHAYELFRADHTDVADIAANLAHVTRADGTVGFSVAEIARIKQHVLFDTHVLDVYDDRGDVIGQVVRRFDPDADMAEAWIRLRGGEPLPEDVTLLEHELREARFFADHPDATYEQAHEHANEQYNWEATIPRRTGENLALWEHDDGHSAAFPEGPGDRPGGGVPVRLPRDGPPADHRQDGPPVQSGGRHGGPRVPGGPGAGHGPGGHGGGLAGRGSGPVLTAEELARAHQIDLAVHRLAGELGPSAHGDFIDRVEAGRDGLVTVTPREGAAFDLRLRAGGTGNDLFRVAVRPDGVREVTISPDLLDGRQGVRVDATVTRAIGHAAGEVSAEGRSRRFGVLRRFGGRDTLTNEVGSDRPGRLSARDLTKVGEFQTLSRLRDNISGPRRTGWVDEEIGRFVERSGLRDGMPGAEHRAELVGRYLSEPERRMLGDMRAAWRDSDPARALARHVLAERPDIKGTVEPLGLGAREFRDVYRVSPDGWARQGRPSFTIEVESGRPAGGELAEISGTDLPRHFRLIVDKDLFAGHRPGDPPVGSVLRDRVTQALKDRIEVQRQRPAEIPRWWVRATERAVGAGAGVGGFEVADLLNAPTTAYKLAGTAAADALTAGFFSRHTALKAAEAAHERAVARSLQVDRLSGDEVRAGLGGVRADVEAIADALGIDRSALHWTPERTEAEPVPSTETVPPGADHSLRQKVDDRLHALSDDAKGVKDISSTRFGHRYKVEVERGRAAKVRMEVGNTADVGKVEVEPTGGCGFRLRVSPELLHDDPDTLHKALTAAFEKVAGARQEVDAKLAHPVARQIKGVAADLAASATAIPFGDAASQHGGVIAAATTGIRKAGEALTSQISGDHQGDLAHVRKSFDTTHLEKSVSATDLGNAARGSLDAAQNLTYLARFTEYRAEHGMEPDPASLATPGRTGDPMPAAHDAMNEVAASRGPNRARLVEWDGDPNQGQAGARHLRYSIDIAHGNRVRLDIVTHDGSGAAPRIEVRRTGWGRFEIELRGGPDPELVHKLVSVVAEDIIDRRGAGIPTMTEYLRSKVLPTVAGGGSVVVVFIEAHSLPGLAIGGVMTTGGLVKGLSDYLHEVHLTDKGLEQSFATLDVGDVHTGDLRTAFSRATIEVEQFESRVAGELRQRLSDLQLETQRAGLTPEQRADLDQRVAHTRQLLDTLPPPDAAVLVPLHAELPALRLPNHGEVRLVDPEQHVFTLTYDRGGPGGALGLGGRPKEVLAFDVVTGDTGGPPVRFLRINSDTAATIVVDPHAPHELVRREIETSLSGVASRHDMLPSGGLDAGSRVVGVGTNVAGAVGQLAGAAVSDMTKLAASAVTSVTTGGGTVLVGAGRALADAGLANIRAVRGWEADLSVGLRTGSATPQQLTVFNARAGFLGNRLRNAFELLEQLRNGGGR